MLTGRIIGAAITVHRHPGPGLLESTCQACLAAELRHLELRVQNQVPVRVVYRDVDLNAAIESTWWWKGCVVVELKVMAAMDPAHTAQALTYLRPSELPVGLLPNFGVPTLRKGGIRRFVWGHSVARPGQTGGEVERM